VEPTDWSATDLFPPLKHQAAYSCSAWATAYYQFTYEVANKRKIMGESNYNNLVFSPDYMFNYLNYKHGENTEGLFHEDCYEFLKKQGCISYSEFYGNDSTPYSWYGTGGESNALNNMREALKYRVSKYHEMTIPNGSNTAPFITGSNDADLNKMKELLDEGKVLGISTPTKNHKYQPSDAIHALIDSYYPLGTAQTSHALTIVGYDDNYYYDLNQNGIKDSGEYGAFIVVDSFVNSNFTENNEQWPGRKYMMMYDSLNKVSSYKNASTGTERAGSIIGNIYWYIDVDYYADQKLTVEVTVSQKERNEFKISLFRKNGTAGQITTKDTFVNAIGGDRGFNGSTNTTTAQSYTFVFDYEAHDLYDGDGYHYGVRIKDLNSNDGKNTVVQKIVWKDKNGTKIKEITPNESINGNSKDYYTTLEKISIQQDNKRIRKGGTLTPNVVVEPFDLNFSYTLASSDSSKITVNGNQITAVEEGYANITATVELTDGKVLSATSRFSVYECFGDTRDNAVLIGIDEDANGFLFNSTDISWLKFTVAETDDYIFNVTGIDLTPNMRAEIYIGDSSTPSIGRNTNNDGIFAAKIGLTVGQTCYIKIYNQNGISSSYRFCVNKSVKQFEFVNDNADARHVQIDAVVSSSYNTLYLTVDGRVYPLSKANTELSIFANTSIYYKVAVNSISDYYTKWTIHMDVSTTSSFVGVVNSVNGIFANYGAGIESASLTASVLAYKTSLIAGVDLSKSNNLALLLNGLEQSGYQFNVYDATGSLISNTNIKAATGMKIVKKDITSGKIVEVYHVVVIGDPQGDGKINNLDASLVLKHDAGTGTITGVYLVAADANQDGNVNNLDSALILKYDAGLENIDQILENIDQILENAEISNEIYFGDSVKF